MSRGIKLTILAAVSLIVWIGTLFTTQGYINEVIKGLPSYGLVLFGCHAFWSIGSGLAILKDYPEESKSLLKEVEEAKSFYKGKLTNM